MEEPKKLKVILIGCAGVGKTCLITKFSEDRFDPRNLSTINAGITSLVISIDDVDYNLQIWDTAGQDKLRDITVIHFRDSLAAMIVFDISQRQTFEEVPSWIELLQSRTRDVPFLIVGNKYDLVQNDPSDDFVSLDELQEMAQRYNCPCFFASALSGYGVNDCFQELSTLAIEPRNNQIADEVQTVHIIDNDKKDPQNNSQNSKCC